MSQLQPFVLSVMVDFQTYESADVFHNIKFSLAKTIMSSLEKNPDYINKWQVL